MTDDSIQQLQDLTSMHIQVHICLPHTNMHTYIAYSKVQKQIHTHTNLVLRGKTTCLKDYVPGEGQTQQERGRNGVKVSSPRARD